jgi:hypothetical protein
MFVGRAGDQLVTGSFHMRHWIIYWL